MPSALSPSENGSLESVPDLSRVLPKLTPRKGSKQLEPPAKPRPQTPALTSPPELGTIRFSKPCRRILSKGDHELFLESPAYTLVTAFIFTLSESVEDQTISQVQSKGHDLVITTILQILDEAESVVSECPPLDSEGSRFGNKAFRDYLDKVEAKFPLWHEMLHVPDAAREEVSTYLKHSFGNWTRIDYGSGHELNFFIWLLCLNRLSLLPQTTFSQTALVIFPRYLKLMRTIQTTYYLEPAGSHGVWGLDDYQFLPFLFGASQLLHHTHIRPMSIHQSMILEQCSKDYLYLDQVAFVNSVKNVEGLRWHSPMLDDISSAKNWIKVEAGMRRMFLAEVLGKLPVMQHFLFGGIVQAADGMSNEQDESSEPSHEHGEGAVMKDGMMHKHAETGWGDCCGIPVPSTIGAMQEMKKNQTDQGLRRIPFD
ncbi:Phosphotyrosyl phosphatase activator [Myriangium duriaei CBS 260.36]|uniref:Serine/threonine-protein phosphatase 2A activator n=1 Tax=Myriangium duriaei CBS 260.36 TaxID=1168546 RepID=A0A9P4MI67_9PEZI|nr:Phosphotyrosyl phosphatase activator [Myriangium duriaei CBS 260.36]